jgi:RNA recognition motif-containing protein
MSAPPGLAPGTLDYFVIMDLEAFCDDPTDVNRQEIIEWPWVVYDLRNRIVVDSKQIYIAPQWSANPNPNPDIVTGLGTDVAFSPNLKDAVAKFDAYLFHSFSVNSKSFCLLTDGPWDLNELLVLEGARKAVPLAPHFRVFFDVRAEFARCYPDGPPASDRQTIVDFLDIPASSASTSAGLMAPAVIAATNAPPGTTAASAAGAATARGLANCHVVAEIVTRMLSDGHVFVNPVVMPEFDWAAMSCRVPAVAIPIASAVPVGGIVRLRGLPWTCVEQDIAVFFSSIPIVPNGIHFVRNAHGKATGEAFVQLLTHESVQLALQHHKRVMGRRYIEVFKSSPVDMSNHLGRADARRQLHQQQSMHAQAHKAAAAAAAAAAVAAAAANAAGAAAAAASPAAGSYHQYTLMQQQQQYGYNSRGVVSGSCTGRSFVLRLHDLPPATTPDDVVRMFDGLEIVGNGIHMAGVTSGAAFVEFTSESWAKKALARSPITIGPSSSPSTVQVIRSSALELMKVMYPMQQQFQENDSARRPRSVGSRSSYLPISGASSAGLLGDEHVAQVSVSVSGEREDEVANLFDRLGVSEAGVFVAGNSSHANNGSGGSGSSGGSGGSEAGNDQSTGNMATAYVPFRSKEDRDIAMAQRERPEQSDSARAVAADAACH